MPGPRGASLQLASLALPRHPLGVRVFIQERLVYIVGEPGAGKSSVVAALTHGLPFVQELKPVPHMLYAGGLVQLARQRPDFGGTDSLAMSIAPKAHAWLASFPHPVVLAEGDRLGAYKWLHNVAETGWDVRLIHVRCGEAEAKLRRETRAARLGAAPQNPTWVKGRRSKVTNLVARWADDHPGKLITLDSKGMLSHELAEALCAQLPWLRPLAATPFRRSS